MDDNLTAVLIAIVGAVSAVVTALLTMRTKIKVEETHTAVNSRVDEFLKIFRDELARNREEIAGLKADLSRLRER